MRVYIIRRLLLMIPTLLLVTMIVFALIRLVPGDIIDLMLEQQQFGSHVDRAELEHKLGLDTPIHIQYGKWLWNTVRGDLGASLWTKRSVIEEVRSKLPVSIELGIMALLIAQLMALPVGIYSAIRQDTVFDYVGRSLAIIFLSVPVFWMGTIIVVFPSVWWQWSPSIRYIPFIEDPIRNLGMFLLPATVVGLAMSGTCMRMTRTMMLEVLRQDYIRTAWAKGLSERTIIFRHALRNALIPVVTIWGVMVPYLIGGQVIVEQIFCLPGIGTLLVNALNDRDYPMLSGVNLLIAILVMANNLVVDLSYAYLDPRIRYG